MNTFSFISNSPKETQAWGKKLGRLLKEGDVVLFIAGLGAGKTTFVQGVASAWGAPLPPVSPTFIIAQTLTGNKVIHHLDFYRLGKGEIWGMGIQDYLEGGGAIAPGLVLIEWADLCPEIWPRNAIRVNIEIAREKRKFKIFGEGARAKEIIRRLKK